MAFKRILKILFVTVLLAFPTLVSAKGEKPSLALNLVAEKEVVKQENGKQVTEWQEVKETKPGDVIRYTVKYVNEGNADATGANITDPIPAGTAYIPNSAEGKDAEISFSLDGKAFQPAIQLRYKARDANGKEVEYVATADMYTHIRWKLLKPVHPSGTGTLVFKVKVK